jgi:hypothetical protein
MDPLELAQLVHGPGYVSLETALSHHGWIPEGVYAITNVSSKGGPRRRFTSFVVPGIVPATIQTIKLTQLKPRY